MFFFWLVALLVDCRCWRSLWTLWVWRECLTWNGKSSVGERAEFEKWVSVVNKVVPALLRQRTCKVSDYIIRWYSHSITGALRLEQKRHSGDVGPFSVCKTQHCSEIINIYLIPCHLSFLQCHSKTGLQTPGKWMTQQHFETQIIWGMKIWSCHFNDIECRDECWLASLCFLTLPNSNCHPLSLLCGHYNGG